MGPSAGLHNPVDNLGTNRGIDDLRLGRSWGQPAFPVAKKCQQRDNPLANPLNPVMRPDPET